MSTTTAIERQEGRSVSRAGTSTRGLEPDIVGILIFIVLLALGLAWPWALTVGAAGFAAVLWMRRRARGSVLPLHLPGARPKAALSPPHLAEARATIARTREAAQDSAAAPIRRSALALCATAERIVDALQRDPNGVAQGGRLRPYLETAQDVVLRYAHLARSRSSLPEVESTLARVEPTLDDLRAALERRLERLLGDETFDLDVELSVLEKTERLDGWLSRP